MSDKYVMQMCWGSVGADPQIFTPAKFHDARLIRAPGPVCSRGVNKNPCLC